MTVHSAFSGTVEVLVGSEGKATYEIPANRKQAIDIPISLTGWARCYAKAEELGSSEFTRILYGDLACEAKSGVMIHAQCVVDASTEAERASVLALGSPPASSSGLMPISIICKK